jgi:putative selenium metabolism hydrolase
MQNSLDFAKLINFTQSLVRIPSFSVQEKAVVERVIEEMRSLGFDRVWIDENGSAVGVIEGARSGPTLLLDGHCDTVGAIPADWSHDPFGAEIVGDVMYGRGAADMKGNLAAMLYAAASVDRARLAGRVAVSATVNEELMEGPTLKAVMDVLHPDGVVIGEATRLNLNRGGRGRAEVVIETRGRSAHSSSPQAGLCAIHEMIKVIQAVEGLEVQVDPLLGPGFMVLTDIISDPYPGHSVIANRCRATYDRRLLVGETMDSVLERINGCVGLGGVDFSTSGVYGEEKTYTGAELKMTKFYPAWKFAEEHPFVQSALLGLRAAGLNPQIGAYRFCTNAAYSAGTANVPTVGFGLGAEEDAHTVDEHIKLKDLEQAEKGYAGVIQAVLNF